MTSMPVLRAHNLHFAYATSPVLHGVDLELFPGQILAIVGDNGAGKSTLIELLAGVRRPTAGSVATSQERALVVQRPSVPDTLPLTVREVVAIGTWARRGGFGRGGFGRAGSGRSGSGQQPAKRGMTRELRRARVWTALDRVDLRDLADRPFTDLSGGQRQRALIAQGLVRQAGILLLDEPAAGLDRESRERAQAILAVEAQRGAAVVCVTHDETAVQQADVVLRLAEGKQVS